jgi:hypothetical protein
MDVKNPNKENLNEEILVNETEINLEYVQNYLRETTFDLVPTQSKLSFPMLERYYKRLQKGEYLHPIKVENDKAIVDGHHRYICGHILGQQLDRQPYPRPNANQIQEWNTVFVDAEDYDPQ